MPFKDIARVPVMSGKWFEKDSLYLLADQIYPIARFASLQKICIATIGGKGQVALVARRADQNRIHLDAPEQLGFLLNLPTDNRAFRVLLDNPHKVAGLPNEFRSTGASSYYMHESEFVSLEYCVHPSGENMLRALFGRMSVKEWAQYNETEIRDESLN